MAIDYVPLNVGEKAGGMVSLPMAVSEEGCVLEFFLYETRAQVPVREQGGKAPHRRCWLTAVLERDTSEQGCQVWTLRDSVLAD